MWNKLCATVGLTVTKMNAHFVPQFFICFQAVNTQNTGLQGPLAGPHACSTSRFSVSLSSFLRHGYKKYLEMRCKVERHNTNSVKTKSSECVKHITAVYIQTFPKLWYFVPRTITLRQIFGPEM